MMTMMRSTALVAALAAFACVPAGPPPTVRDANLPDEEPVVRIGLAVDTAEVTVSATGPYDIIAAGDVQARSRGEVVWRFSADDEGRLTGESSDGRTIALAEGPLHVRPLEGATVRIAGKPYRGAALVRAVGPGRVSAINIVAIEEYLLGVVPAEIPSLALEAVKAQAIAARTYAIGHLGNRESHGFDFYATVADQVYGGIEREDPMAARAVRETRGEIVAYQGRPILAYYHSTCGGMTAAVDEVWNRAPLPYLKPVSDRVPGTEDAYYCEASNRFRWTVDWSEEELEAALRAGLANYTGQERTVERVGAVEVLERTPSDRVAALRIVADGREYTVRGDSVRWVLRPEPGRILNSSRFDVEPATEGGAVRSLTVRGGGWGHGIGMCQMGAIGRAKAGHDYTEILTAYYTDTRVIRLY